MQANEDLVNGGDFMEREPIFANVSECAVIWQLFDGARIYATLDSQMTVIKYVISKQKN